MPGGPFSGRPVMPGYGILPADRGSGLMPWAEAERRLGLSHDFWVATVRPDGRPHVMPVWGVWREVTDAGAIAAFVDAVDATYDADLTVDFQDPEVNATFAVRAVTVIALTHGDFTGSPTRWRFGAD